jgi:adenylate cyclase class 2
MKSNIEYEIKILDIDRESIITTIKNNGGKFAYKRLLRNAIFYTLERDDLKYIRVRDDGEETTITYKMIHKNNISTTEIELRVDSYDKASEILVCSGLEPKRSDEKIRERYTLGSVFLDFDTWPMIPTYLEIEASNEQEILQACQLLDLDFSKRFLGDTLDVFRYHGLIPEQLRTLSFNR